jgi:outer membrane protein OmpA-like peptidoglycan-associated protein
MNKYILSIVWIISMVALANGQEPLTHQPKLYVDETGQVFTKADLPAYFFITPANNPGELMAIQSADPNASPMYWDGNGVHYISHKDPNTKKTILFKVMADGIPPTSNIEFTSGAIFNISNRYFVEMGAVASVLAKDIMTGVSETYYSINNSPFEIYKGELLFTTEGENTLKFYSVDMVGNVELPKEFLILTSIDEAVQMENIYFNLNSANLLPESIAEIDKLVNLLKKYSNIKIELRAHTDTRGEARYNMELSIARAHAVEAYMLSKGIEKGRLSSNGFGDTRPINDCKKGIKCPEEMHRKNRRVEFLISKIKD